jgi:hypothetical protein
MVEGILSLILIASIIVASANATSLGISKIWIEHCLFQNMRCELQAENVRHKNCRSQLVNSLKLLSWGEVKQFSSYQMYDKQLLKSTEVRLNWCNEVTGEICEKEKLLKFKFSLREKDLRDLRL